MESDTAAAGKILPAEEPECPPLDGNTKRLFSVIHGHTDTPGVYITRYYSKKDRKEYPMSLLQNLQNMVQQGVSGISGSLGNDALSKLLGPAALGGLAGLLLSSKAARGSAAGALLAGGGALLWNKYKDRIMQANSGSPEYGQTASAPDERAGRLIRAMVFAAKSDGHIDDKEQQAIQAKLRDLNLGPEGESLVQKALEEPLDPSLIAKGVSNADEALELYTLSCAVMDVDHFMERSYLEALGQALNIPPDVRAEIMDKLKTA